MFKFKLEKVLQHRKTLEVEARRLLEEMYSYFQEEKNKLTFLEESLANINSVNYETLIGKGFHSAHFQTSEEYRKGLEIKIQRQKDQLAEVENIMEKQRLVLLEKSKEYKIVEKLKDKKLKEYKDLKSKKEQKFLDEMSQRVFKQS
jgi:flagellar FliJ protein